MTDLDRRQLLGGLGAIAAGGGLVAAGAVPAFAASVAPGADAVLLVIDVQNDFLPGGSLAVKDGDQVIPVINELGKRFQHVIFTQDWHTPGHISFASSHPGKQPYDVIDVPYGKQVLWPDHCVEGSEGAAFAAALDVSKAEAIIHKGFRQDVDSYSAFVEGDRKTVTGLAGYLKDRGLGKVFVVGLATDFCVAWSALDAKANGFEVFVVEDGCRGIDANGSLQKAWDDMAKAGLKRIQSADVAA